MTLKVCSKCKIEKDVSEFYKQARQSSGLHPSCKTCLAKCHKERYERCKDYILSQSKIRYINNSAIINRNNKKCSLCKNIKNITEFSYYSYSPDKHNYRCRDCVSKINSTDTAKKALKERRFRNRDIINKRARIRTKTDPCFRLSRIIKTVITKTLKNVGSSKNGKSTFDYLSYSKEELVKYIESQFEPWMNWNNMGKYNPTIWNDNDCSTWTWQLDHIIPKSEFFYASMEDENFKKCWSLNNLRPLSAKQNIVEGARRIRHNQCTNNLKQGV